MIKYCSLVSPAMNSQPTEKMQPWHYKLVETDDLPESMRSVPGIFLPDSYILQILRREQTSYISRLPRDLVVYIILPMVDS